MTPDWITRRLKTFEEKQAKIRLREQYEHNAISAFPSMFEALTSRVASDVRAYNELFGTSPHLGRCRAGFEKLEDGFMVEVGDTRVRVQKANATIVAIAYSGANYRPADHLQLVPDESGNLRFKDSEGTLLGVEKASEIILDPVLCG